MSVGFEFGPACVIPRDVEDGSGSIYGFSEIQSHGVARYGMEFAGVLKHDQVCYVCVCHVCGADACGYDPV